jgi:hypothetical protein
MNIPAMIDVCGGFDHQFATLVGHCSLTSIAPESDAGLGEK